MGQTNEYFTLETLGKFYTAAAKAEGIEVCGWDGWYGSNGPNLTSKVANYRLKQLPLVLYKIRYLDGSAADRTWESYEAAADCLNNLQSASMRIGSKVIKFIEEVS
jgi:hypothetical protein